MVGPQNFLDNLENLRLTTGVALEYLQDHVSGFAKSASSEETRHAERLISKIRILSEQLEREFAALDRVLSRARTK